MSESEQKVTATYENATECPAIIGDQFAELRFQLRQTATALARNRDERVLAFVDALLRLDFGRQSMPAGLESGPNSASPPHVAIVHAIENVASMLSILLDEVRALRNESNR